MILSIVSNTTTYPSVGNVSGAALNNRKNLKYHFSFDFMSTTRFLSYKEIRYRYITNIFHIFRDFYFLVFYSNTRHRCAKQIPSNTPYDVCFVCTVTLLTTEWVCYDKTTVSVVKGIHSPEYSLPQGIQVLCDTLPHRCCRPVGSKLWFWVHYIITSDVLFLIR